MEKSINTCMKLGSSLPLIFVGGRPACLGNMTVPQLKRFIPFMMHCEGMGHEIPLEHHENVAKPCWWPVDLEYSMNIYAGDVSTDELLSRLRDIVWRCYNNYSLCSIISLSASMSDPKNPFGFVRIEHNDNGTSNVISFSNKLVVTIRTSVVKYDEEIFTPETNIAIRQCPYNRPILKLVKSSCLDSKYVDGGIHLTYSNLKSIPKLNPSVMLPGVIFVNSEGLKVQYPFLESCSRSVFMAGQVSTLLDGDNVCKVVVLSDYDAKEDNCVSQRNGLSLPNREQTFHGPKCRYCGKVFSGEDFCKDHENCCLLAPEAPQQTDSDTLENYLSRLDLIPTKTVMEHPPVKEKYQMIIDKLNNVPQSGTMLLQPNKSAKLRPKRISLFFKLNPIPFTSSLGLQLIRHSGTGISTSNKSTNIDQLCSTSDRKPLSNNQNNRVTKLKKNPGSHKKIYPKKSHKGTEKQDWFHSYSFNRKQRTIRNSEIVVGLNKKAWPSLNLCRKNFVQMRKDDTIPDDVLKQCRADYLNSCQPFNKNDSFEPSDPISFEDDIPIIKIENIFKVEKYAKYFQKLASKN